MWAQIQTALKSDCQAALRELEPEYDGGSGGEQDSRPADSQADCRQARPTRSLEKLQPAMLTSRSGKTTDGPATGTLSHTKPPPRAAAGSRIGLDSSRSTG